jgi:hypothetical protein
MGRIERKFQKSISGKLPWLSRSGAGGAGPLSCEGRVGSVSFLPRAGRILIFEIDV